MKNVLVLIHDDAGQEARLQVALDLTRALSGHLNCLDAAIPSVGGGAYLDVSNSAIAVDCVARHEAKNRSRVETRLRGEGVSWSMHETIGAPGRAFREAAALTDLIVLSFPRDHADDKLRRLVGEVAVKAGRPVVAVPASCRGFNVAGKALVGWNGSPEASEAVRQGLPLLQQATSVTLLSVDQPKGDLSPDEAARYLSRHGIHAEIVTRESDGSTVSDVILGEAHALGAAYVLIGAYGLPRSIEALFGGVTSGMLLESELPILLAR